jgi:hypothetical protein
MVILSKNKEEFNAKQEKSFAFQTSGKKLRTI